MWKYNTNELYHYGILGMRWGHRKINRGNYNRRLFRPHAGLGIRIGTERQLAGDKSDLKYLENGGHLSIGLTKKRQAYYDARDKKNLQARIKKNQDKLNRLSDDYKQAKKLSKKKLSEMSNDEIKTLNKRRQLETDYKRLNKGQIAKGMAIIGSTSAFTASVLTIKNNAPQLIDGGKKAVNSLKNLRIK